MTVRCRHPAWLSAGNALNEVTSQHTGPNRRDIDRSSRPLLSGRVERTDPYLFIGEGDLESASGNRPIAITWRLRTPLPDDAFQAARRVPG